MFTDGAPQTLVHLPRTPSSPSDQLPKGECRFILPKADSDCTQQRCSCVSFTLNKTIPGSQCGCGHQAWHHLPESAQRSVPLEEHFTLLERMRRSDETIQRLQDELARERRAREEDSKKLDQMNRGIYQNMAVLRYMFEEKLEVQRIHSEDKTEGVLDKAHGAIEDIAKLKSRISDIDETIIRIEERFDSAKWLSQSVTPKCSPSPPKALPAPTASKPASIPLPIRVEEKHPEAWDVRIILVPDKRQPFAFPIDSAGYRRCQSRGMAQDLHFQDKSARQFVQCVDAGFATILRGRTWLPLKCLRSDSMQLAPLPVSQIMYLMWDWAFLEKHCLAQDKLQGEIIYIALQDEVMSWAEIQKLPRVFGSDESCWQQDRDMDSGMGDAGDMVQESGRIQTPALHGRRTEAGYENSPPPYSSRHLETTRGPSALGVLAAAASYSSSSSNLTSPTSTSNINALLNPDDYDEHRDKRTRTGTLRPEPHPIDLADTRTLSTVSSNVSSERSERPSTASGSIASPPQQQLYLSGRSKRKINPAKQREPMDWRPSEMKLTSSMRGLIHRHGKAPAQSDATTNNLPQQMDMH